MDNGHRNTAVVVGGDMPNDQTVNIRLPAELLAEAEELVPALESDAELRATGRVSRSTVLRLAVFRGIRDLRRTYGRPKGKKAKGRK